MHLRMVDVYPLMAAAAINAMRDAAAISQEPVAWRTKNDAGHWHVTADRAGAETWVWEKFDVEPLYGAHAQRADTSADVSTTKGSE
jgi:hypothetical protein